ncbi:hypothetical protein [Streptomyces fulvoviolaceus]|uniref:hypothetical protein n=1 Tax=Streptomyces fulvoviolaceus TaxID=285535 RepID=UPI0004C6EAF9|nr:hypothetical protein [Streptomyces fulvoviolaceus]MCT9083315.1 hypothetical protein [Streptomyces fulvoviolaceus]
MPEHVSVYQLLGMTLLALVTVAWAIGLVFMLRRGRFEAALRRTGHILPALPYQRQVGPRVESVELTPAEEDAFAGLVRQLSSGR